MKVVVKKSVLDQVINQLVEERGYHSRRIDQIAGEGNPVLPDAQVATQLSQDTLDVEDPDFLPVNKRDLSLAASEIASKVSPGKIQKFYAGLKTLLKKTSSPDRQKGMSETDLMEALRPIVVREAMRLVDPEARSFVASGRGKATQDEPEASTVDTGVRTDVPDAPRAPRRKIIKSSPAPTEEVAKDVFVPKVSKDLIRQAKKNKKEKSDEISDFEQLLGQSQQNMDAIFSNMLRRKAKISLADVVVGDANRFIDEYYKASASADSRFSIPKSLKAANVRIQVSETTSKVDGIDQPIRQKVVQFFDLERPDRGFSKKAGPIVHSGGPIAAVREDKFGNKENIIYYLVYNFPFTEEEYIAEFERQLEKVTKERSRQAADEIIASDRKKKEAETAAQADVFGTGESDSKEKEARKATIQKILSVANADEMALETLSAIEELAIEGNDAAIEKVFKSLKLPTVSSSGYNRMSDEEKTNLQNQIKNVYDSNRKAFYDISHMDYVRDVLDWEDFTSRYGLENEEIVSADVSELGEMQLLQAFFEKAFKPRMISAFKVISDQNPKMKSAISSVYGPRMQDYDSFVTSVDRAFMVPYKDAINEITKSYIINNQDVFKKTIPDFYNMLSGVKKKEGTEDYDVRLKAIGMSDIGRQREPFEYLRSITATMKAVSASALLEILEGRKEIEKFRSADEIKRAFRTVLAKAKGNPEIVSEILYNKDMNYALGFVGLNNINSLLNVDIEAAMAALQDKKIFDILEKRQGKFVDLESPDIQEHVQAVVQKFINKMSEYFEKLGKEGSLADRGPIYELVETYGFYVKEADDSIKAGEIADLLQDFSEMGLAGVEKAKAEKKKQEKKVK